MDCGRGDTLFIETTVMKGTGKLVLTGQLGDVMQESAKAGLSVIRARSENWELMKNSIKIRIFVHIPEERRRKTALPQA